MATNKIFTNNIIPKIGKSSFVMDRAELLSKDVAEGFNTYRNWGMFGILAEPARLRTEEDQNKKKVYLGDSYKQPGVKALFNNSNAIGADLRYQQLNNAPLLDAPLMRDQLRRIGDCSIKALIEDSKAGRMGRAIYNYSDFMYCKYLGKVSNNYLITLRRFPYPCGDHINITDPDDKTLINMQKHMPDVGRLVTWMGTPGNDMSNILKYNVKMPYKELNAEMQEPASNKGEQGGFLGNLLNAASPKYQSMVVKGTAGAPILKTMQSAMNWGAGMGPQWLSRGVGDMTDRFTEYDATAYHNFCDKQKADGPVNVISKTHTRMGGAEGGLEFNQEIQLVFDYELRSYDGINGKAAFLDLLSNILAVTYTNGKFWGGGFRSAGVSQSNVFANLPIYKLGDKQPMTFSTVTDAFMDTVGQVGSTIAKQNGGGKEGGSILDVLQNLGKGLLNMFIGGAINQLGRPQKQAFNSLLNPAPVGLWHLTIGNPKHPIMMMGNMILDDVTIEHYGPLGLDDFPTGIKVEIKLKHAKPRDAMQIEQMYMMGDYRIYYPMSGEIAKIYENSSRYKEVTPPTDPIEDAPNNIENAQMSTKVDESGNVVPNVSKSEDIGSERDIYSIFFGTRDSQLINQAASEAAWGAHAPNPPSDGNSVKKS